VLDLTALDWISMITACHQIVTKFCTALRDQNCEDEFVGHQSRTTTSGFTRMRKNIQCTEQYTHKYSHRRVLAKISLISRFLGHAELNGVVKFVTGRSIMPVFAHVQYKRALKIALLANI
jgi:hypothetical protein